MMNPQTRQSGYALLLTLLLLAIAAVALADMGRRSAASALRALAAEDQLQRRWAVRSAEAVLLPQTDRLLEAEEARRIGTGGGRGNVQLVSLRKSFELGGRSFEFVFSDEQAKVNLNTLHQRRGDGPFERVLQRITTASALELLPRTRPVDERQRRLFDLDESWPRFTAFDQLLDSAPPDRLVDLDQQSWRPAFTEVATLWGDGRVHVRRASQEVLEAALAPDLGPAQIQRLLAARRQRPAFTLDDALDALDLTHQQRRRMSRRLTAESHCVSLWSVHRDRDRNWHQLAVLEQAPGKAPRIHRLIW